MPRLALTRSQILAFRRRVGALDQRLPPGPISLRHAAWAGLQDSMPRAALLSIHARVKGTKPTTWEDPSLVQIWGPRYSVFVVPAGDLALFTLGVYPDDDKGRLRAEDRARRVKDYLKGRRMSYAEVGHAIGVPPNGLRFASVTGTVLMRWEGARRPTIWTVPAPEISEHDARLELARHYLHVYGPASSDAFGWWSGIGPKQASLTFESLRDSLIPVRTPVADAWILAADEPATRAQPVPTAPARLLPSGDAYFLLQGSDRELLLPDPARRRELWTSRVWPGAVLVGGEVAGTWRRADANVTVRTWNHPTRAAREAVEIEAASLPLPGVSGQIKVRWES